MDESGFKAWLEARDLQPNAISTRLHAVRRIEKILPDMGSRFADLDAAYAGDQLASTIAAIREMKVDARNGGTAFKLLLPDSQKPHGRLTNFASWLGQYRQFKVGEGPEDTDAARIRRHAYESYIVPAREDGLALVTIPVREVLEALGLTQGWRNVCQALSGSKFLEIAETPRPLRTGASDSTTTRFTFNLDDGRISIDTTKALFREAFGEPIKDAVRVFAAESADGRQIAFDPSGTEVLVWIEATKSIPEAVAVKRRYGGQENRHHGLPARLSHTSPEARPVALCPVKDWDALVQLVEFYLAPVEGEPASLPIQENKSMASTAPKATNRILYGPPGTGKTYRTAQEAVGLCSPGVDLKDRDAVMAEYHRLSKEGRIEFVTFHQSYGYEEFVEGMQPKTNGEGGVGFRLEPELGTFRRIAKRAETSKGSGGAYSIQGRQVFKMSIGEAANPDDAFLFEEALRTGYALLGFGEIDWSDDRFSSRDAILDAWRKEEPEKEGTSQKVTAQSARVKCPDAFRNRMKVGDLIIVTKGNGLFRAIGEIEGGYEFVERDDGVYPHRRKVRWLWIDQDGVRVEEICNKHFSMLTLYRLSPEELNREALERYIASQQAPGEPEQFVLIIDEINRANISKVFGELITLIERDKRLKADGTGLRVRLPYSKDWFGVPSNLHIIGTMNTADRSIALLDTALRRRFDFEELMPDPDLPQLQVVSAKCKVDVGKLLRALNERIEYLFDREHQIGHAYFVECGSRAELDDIMRHKVIPLLAEYFYEDWSKVALVLGKDGGGFLERTELKAPDDADGDARARWSVRRTFADNRYDVYPFN